jgi:hypothetical protein
MTRRSASLLRLGVVASVGAIVLTAYLTLLWPRLTHWGATQEEVHRPLPVGQVAPSPMYQSTRAIDIQAPPKVVWAWLVQLGQGRGGFYSYTWLENLVGADIHNAIRIRPDLQHLAVGDTVRLAPAGFLGGAFDRSSQLRVAAVDPGHLLVLRGWGTFVLDSLPGERTRLLVREQTVLPAHPWRAALFKLAWEPPHFIMERQMLRGIRDRAEGRVSPGWLSGLATLGFAAMAFTLVGMLSRRRSWWPWMLWPMGGAVAVILATGDAQAALAAFVGTGTVIVGALFARRAWWKWSGGVVALVSLILLLARDAYLALGWLLGIATLLVLMTAAFKHPEPATSHL